MPYALRIDYVQQLVWDSLPQAASDQLALVLAAVCDDPFGETLPYGVDDGITRMLVLPTVVVALLVSDASKQVGILQITYLG